MDLSYLLFFTLINQIIIAFGVKYFQKIYESIVAGEKKDYSNEETFYSVFSILSWSCLLLNFNKLLLIPLILFNFYPFKKFGWGGYLFSAIVNIIYLTAFIIADIFKINLFIFV